MVTFESVSPYVVPATGVTLVMKMALPVMLLIPSGCPSPATAAGAPMTMSLRRTLAVLFSTIALAPVLLEIVPPAVLSLSTPEVPLPVTVSPPAVPVLTRLITTLLLGPVDVMLVRLNPPDPISVFWTSSAVPVLELMVFPDPER